LNYRAGAPSYGYGRGDSQGLTRLGGGPPYSYSREVQGLGRGREHNNTRVVVAAIPNENRQEKDKLHTDLLSCMSLDPGTVIDFLDFYY